MYCYLWSLCRDFSSSYSYYYCVIYSALWFERMRRVHVRSLEIVRIAHVYFKNIRDMYTQKLFGFLDNGCFGEGNISYLPFEIYSSYSHSSLVMNTRNPAFPRDSIPCFPISLTLSFRGTLATLTFFFFWRVILLDVANLWCFTTWSLDLLTRRSTYSPAFFWRCGAKNVVFLSPLLSLLSPFLQPAGSCFLACISHKSESHVSLKLWWYIYQTHIPRPSVLNVFPL